MERALRLIKLVEKWDRCAPDVIKTFLEHTVRTVTVGDNGEIDFTIEGRKVVFCHGGIPLAPGLKGLGYFHRDDPQFLFVTSGDGRILGTWYQRGRTEYLDQAALAQAMRYTHAARTVATATARELARPETAQLEDMRRHNAALQDFTATCEVLDGAHGVTRPTEISAGLAGVKTQKKEVKKQQQRRDADHRAAREALRNLSA